MVAGDQMFSLRGETLVVDNGVVLLHCAVDLQRTQSSPPRTKLIHNGYILTDIFAFHVWEGNDRYALYIPVPTWHPSIAVDLKNIMLT